MGGDISNGQASRGRCSRGPCPAGTPTGRRSPASTSRPPPPHPAGRARRVRRHRRAGRAGPAVRRRSSRPASRDALTGGDAARRSVDIARPIGGRVAPAGLGFRALTVTELGDTVLGDAVPVGDGRRGHNSLRCILPPGCSTGSPAQTTRRCGGGTGRAAHWTPGSGSRAPSPPRAPGPGRARRSLLRASAARRSGRSTTSSTHRARRPARSCAPRASRRSTTSRSTRPTTASATPTTTTGRLPARLDRRPGHADPRAASTSAPNYDNAFWDGAGHMFFGDGDGQILTDTTTGIDVIGHELTHGVTQHEANLPTPASPARSTSRSPTCSASWSSSTRSARTHASRLAHRRRHRRPGAQPALRSMKAPGTANPHDNQPADMDGYVDDGDVHTNSGIPNHAFYVVATTIGGNAWEAAGPIWYATLLRPAPQADRDLLEFAGSRCEHAAALRRQSARGRRRSGRGTRSRCHSGAGARGSPGEGPDPAARRLHRQHLGEAPSSTRPTLTGDGAGRLDRAASAGLPVGRPAAPPSHPDAFRYEVTLPDDPDRGRRRCWGRPRRATKPSHR